MISIRDIRNSAARWVGPQCDAITREFTNFCRLKWPRPAGRRDGPVVLVGQRAWRPSICANAVLANFLAHSRGWSIHSGFFGRQQNRVLDYVHASFGCKPVLNWRSAAKHRHHSSKIANQIVENLHTKEDIFAISVAGVPIGDLVYDTYLRYYLLPTVDVSDSRLHGLIFQAILAGFACEEYFASNQVGAYLAYDAPYIESGIIHRFAVRERIPVYCARTPQFGVLQMDGVIRGDPSDFRNWPAKTGASLHDRSKFRSLTAAEQARARDLARWKLQARLNGMQDRELLPSGNSAYGATGEERRVFRETGKPRVIVLLHDFCDAPNVLRWSLFPDFWEWLNFLLSRAQQTPFDWYVKPHPHLHSDKAKGTANSEIVREFMKRYPRVTFVESSVSNRQLINEGISSMFTVHGSAAHEFAYMNVPVVNAGYNHHINYSFNIHARSKEQYAELIKQAGYLTLEIDKSEVEEFVFSHSIDTAPSSGIWLIPESYHVDPEMSKLQATTDVYSAFMKHDTPMRDTALNKYLTSYYS